MSRAQYTPAQVGETRDELQRISESINHLLEGNIESESSAPGRPRFGMLRIADGVNWDPLGLGIPAPVWYDGAAWQALGSGANAPSRLLMWFLQ